jgi:Spy/CpxP family protein refolding chaperone
MSSKRVIALQAAAVLGLLAALPAVGLATFVQPAHARGPDMAGFGPPPVMRVIRELDLTNAQRDQVFAIIDRYQPGMRKLMFSMGDGREALDGVLAQGGFEPARIEENAAAQGEAARALYVTTAKMLSEISTVLTPAQRAQIAERQTSGRPMEFRGH